MIQLSLVPEMTTLEKAVYDILLQHQGRNNAILSDHIIEKLITNALPEISRRELCDVIVTLIITHHIRIGSSTGNPPGYFLIVTEDDAKYAVLQLNKRIRELARRSIILQGITAKELSKQIEMEL